MQQTISHRPNLHKQVGPVGTIPGQRLLLLVFPAVVVLSTSEEESSPTDAGTGYERKHTETSCSLLFCHIRQNLFLQSVNPG